MRLWPLGRKNASPENNALGPRGEQLAADYLKKKGFKILGRNYRCPKGEIDIIALDRSTKEKFAAETIVFAEVKTRTSDYYASPQAAVNRRKKRKIQQAARYYLSKHDTGGFNVRYDIVAIVAPENRLPVIEHIENVITNY